MVKVIKELLLEKQNLAAALEKLHQLADEHKQLITGNLLLRLAEIEGDYERMRDFMLRGYQDNQREELYHSLLRKTYRLTCDFQLRLLTGGSYGAFPDAIHHTASVSWSHEEVKTMLEEFVQNVAMLSLDASLQENPSATTASSAMIYNKHAQQTSLLFEAILISPQWNKGDQEFYTNLMLSPTIDINDARLLASAIMLAAMVVPDFRKINTLCNVYEQATDDALRQRCLVGIAFSLPQSPDSLLADYRAIAERICSKEETRKELLELQMQVFFCMNTEKDNATIQRDIMPGLMKNQQFQITRFGIEEKESDHLEDILHPDAEDKAMEELERNINKMREMHKAGADVYFGGFSHMKRYSFFYTLSNWFTPFYQEHPALSNVSQQLKGSRILDILLAQTPLCDSDKYSFALGVASVFNQLPENVRQMIEQAENIEEMNMGTDLQSPAYLRRSYLQDLFRFFRLYTQKGDFPSPFDYDRNHERFFFANRLFASTKLSEQALPLERFLLKRQQLQALMDVLDNFIDHSSPDYFMMQGLLAMKCENYPDAQIRFEQALRLQPDNEKILKALAQASFLCGDYSMAEESYEKLVEQNPDNHQYELNLAISQVNNCHAEEGVTTLYKLHFEQEDNRNVLRGLAWGLMIQQRLDQAEKYYQMLVQEQPSAADCLNAGYCMWFKGSISEAADLMKKYLKLHAANNKDSAPSEFGKNGLRHQLSSDFQNDKMLFDIYKINDVDQKIMIDIVCS
ncbi:MAG: tetratricopeptide repeat protein [Prevotella sp.]|nr:tetratricopeptide repeat protein [Prevotella sp.]